MASSKLSSSLKSVCTVLALALFAAAAQAVTASPQALTSSVHSSSGPSSPASLNSTALLSAQDLGVPYVLTASWVKGTSDVLYFRARSVVFRLGADGKTLDLVDQEPNGLGTLYSFRILTQNEQGYQIDMLTGFSHVYAQSALYLPEQAVEREAVFQLQKLPIPEGVEKRFRQDGRLFSVDLAKYPYPIEEPILSGESECLRVTSRYCFVNSGVIKQEKVMLTDVHLRLAPQKFAPNFKMKADNKAQGIGYYATFPDAKGLSYMTRRASSGNMIWYVDVPDSMRVVVNEAVSYWNRIFGREFLQVRDLHAGKDLWEPYVNSIVYYPKDPAGGAAGVFSMLPSGEMITGHVYVPAGFIGYAESSFDYYVKELRALGLSEGAIATARARFVHDYQVQTFAHEIGHSLGLRHNFKGSTMSNIVDLHASILNYLVADQIRAEESPSSSVMDYMGLDYFALMGAKIRQAKEGRLVTKPLSYDAAAIQWGYSLELEPIDTAKAGPYCDLPEDLAQARYHSPQDLTCSSWDEPMGMKVIRVDLGSQKAILYGSVAQIRNQCRVAWDEKVLATEGPKELMLSVPGNSLELKKSHSSPFATAKDVCDVIENLDRIEKRVKVLRSRL